MEFLNFLRDDPVMMWLSFLFLLVTIVPIGILVWHKLSGRTPADEKNQTMQYSKPVRFGSQVELVILFFGLVILLGLAMIFLVG